jgi:thiol-disulfide isomerase/thioredoxin
MKELPHEVELSQRYASAGLKVIGINADETREVGRAAAEENSLPWLNLYEGKERWISKQLGIRSWPTLFLLDGNRTVIEATPYLRSSTVRILDDGEQRVEHRLDWALEELMGGKSDQKSAG